MTGRFIQLFIDYMKENLEVAEARFVSLAGMDDLVRLKQLCCWLLD